MSGANNGDAPHSATPKQEALVRSVGLVVVVSTLARGISLVGSMLYTGYFGYSLETDIYSYAINLPNLIFTCVGTALVTVVIPIYAGRVASGETERADGFIDNILTVSLILAALIAAAGIIFSPVIVGMIERFRTGAPELALFALRLMFPVMIFHAVNYIMQGVLQTHNRFLLPAAVSAFSGLSVVIYVTFFASPFGIRGLLAATFIGLAAQALVLIPPVAGVVKYRYKPSLSLADPDVRLAGKLALPVLVSSSSYQFNMFMNSTFAAAFEGGVITVTNMLTLAFTASQLFVISALSVFFPKMSARYAVGDHAGFRESFYKVMRLIIVFAIPASAALAYLSRLIVALLYGRGKVTEGDIAVSAGVFAIYAASIASIGVKEAADRAFYALRDSRSPAGVSVIIMAINIALSYILTRVIGVVGLPVAYFIAITSGAAILILLLRQKMRKLTGNCDKPAPENTGSIGAADAVGTADAAGTADTVGTADADGAADTAFENGRGAGTADADGASDTAGTAGTTVENGRGAGLRALTIKCLISTCAMLAVMLLAEFLINRAAGGPAGKFLGSAYGLSVIGQIVRVAILTAAGGGTYAAMAAALGVGEARIITVDKILAFRVKIKRKRK